MKKLFKKIVLLFCFTLIFCFKAFAAKYTLTTGRDFNIRLSAATDIEKITAFKRGDSIPDGATLIDISEDGDSSILCYIENGIIYYVSDDDVSFNKDMSYMFDKFTGIKRISLEDFDFSKCRDMSYMFGNCLSLTDLNLDNDTNIMPSKIEGLFINCQSLTDINLYMLDTKNVTSFKDIFKNCTNIKNIEVSTDNFVTSKVRDYTGIFTGCKLLKTNFGKRASDMDESLYKTYCRTGDDDIEGFLKDIDYEYDDYGENDKTIKIDNNYIYNINDISSNDLKEAKKYLNAKISTDSTLISLSAKDKKILTDDDVQNLLISESTYVPDFAKKLEERRKKEDAALDYGIEEEETYVSTVSVGRVMRPTLDDWKKMGVEDGREIDESEGVKKYTVIDQSIIFVILAIILIILIGLFIHKRNEKKDDKELDDFR